MTVEEIFSNLHTHMLKGLMIHRTISDAFLFLNLYGYHKCHEYHYYEESINCKELSNFFLNYYHKLLIEQEIKPVQIIPSNWYKYAREDVDTNTKRQSVRDLFKYWIDWEIETCTLLNTYHKQLSEMNEFFAADKILNLLKETKDELAAAYQKFINLKTLDYNILPIIEEQDSLYKLYSEKIQNLHKEE